MNFTKFILNGRSPSLCAWQISPHSCLSVDLGMSFWHILHLENISDLTTAMLRKHSQCVKQRLLELTSMTLLLNQPVVSVCCFNSYAALPWIFVYVVFSLTYFFFCLYIMWTFYLFRSLACISDFQWNSTHYSVNVCKMVMAGTSYGSTWYII